MALPSFILGANPLKENPQSGLITSWSNSTLDNFMECEWRSYLKHVLRIKVVKPEFEEGMVAANDRGSELHSMVEDFIQGETDQLPAKIKHRRELILEYRQWRDNDYGSVKIEEEWAFDSQWKEALWRDQKTWHRQKIDAMFFESETSARIDDWKSGKKYQNEGKHMRQLMTYSVGAFMKFPRLQHIKASMQYIDQATDNILTKNVSREYVMRYLPKLENQALAMTTCRTFTPKPNKSNCKFCDFALTNPATGQPYCEYAIKEL